MLKSVPPTVPFEECQTWLSEETVTVIGHHSTRSRCIPASILWLRCGRQGRARFKPKGASASTLTLGKPRLKTRGHVTTILQHRHERDKHCSRNANP